jgi:hypothetical protein
LLRIRGAARQLYGKPIAVPEEHVMLLKSDHVI